MNVRTDQRLTLYVAGASPNSSIAIRTLAALLRQSGSKYDLHIVDVHRHAAAAHSAGVLTVPALVLMREDSTSFLTGAIDEQSLRARLRNAA